MLVVGMTAVGASSAYFTASSVDSGNVVAAGGVQLALAPSSEIVDLQGIEPGLIRTGTITVTNTLNEAAVMLGVADYQEDLVEVEAGEPLVGTSLDQVLDVEVRETSPEQVVRFTGKLGALHGIPVGTLGPGATASYTVIVRWPPEDDDRRLQGATAFFVFEWSAVGT